MSKLLRFFFPAIALIACDLALGAPGNLTITAEIPPQYLWFDGSEYKLVAGWPFEIYIYSNHEGAESDPRIGWSASFIFTETREDNSMPVAPITSYSSVATPQFISFWDVFQQVYPASWDNTSPNMICYTGIATSAGYPGGLGNIPVLKFGFEYNWECVNNWQICINAYGAVVVCDWVFEDPQPVFVSKCWTVLQPPCGYSQFTNLPSKLSIPAGEISSYDFEAENINPENPVQFRLMSGPGSIDSVTGVWSYFPDSILGWTEATLELGVRGYCQCPTFRTVPLVVRGICGNVNGDLAVNILDVAYLLSYLYKGGAEPPLLISGDVNQSGGINILDVSYLISYLYKNGAAPTCP